MAKRKRRNFTPEFKAKVVLEALSGESSPAELCRKPHNFSGDQLSKWKQQVVENVASLLPRRINTPARRPSGLHTSSRSLGG